MAARWLATTRPASAAPLRRRLIAVLARPFRRWRAEQLVPVGPPIERIAADLRRLQRWLDLYSGPGPLPGKALRVAATTMAYDRVLVDACRALEIPESLDETRGFEREAERLRVQAALIDAGFVFVARRRASS